MRTNKHELSDATDSDGLLKDEVYQVTGLAMQVLNSLGNGFLEKVYENALAKELLDHRMEFDQQVSLSVFYKDKVVGTYTPDFVIGNALITEIKTIDKIAANEIGQVLNYLKATGLKVGLILNFKYPKLEWKRVVA